jgi:hypothetical protein
MGTAMYGKQYPSSAKALQRPTFCYALSLVLRQKYHRSESA